MSDKSILKIAGTLESILLKDMFRKVEGNESKLKEKESN